MQRCLIILSLGLAFGINAQTSAVPKIPENYHWESSRDYKRDEEQIIRTLQWLCRTPINSEVENRSTANLYVMEWIAGSPRIKIEIDSQQLPFYQAYPDLLFAYVQGIALKKLAKQSNDDEQQAVVGGFNTVGYMIATDPVLRKEVALHPLLKAYKKNKMLAFVEALEDSKKNP